MSNFVLVLLMPVSMFLGYLAGFALVVGLNVREMPVDTTQSVNSSSRASVSVTEHTIVLDTCWDCRVQGTLPSWAFYNHEMSKATLR